MLNLAETAMPAASVPATAHGARPALFRSVRAAAKRGAAVVAAALIACTLTLGWAAPASAHAVGPQRGQAATTGCLALGTANGLPASTENAAKVHKHDGSGSNAGSFDTLAGDDLGLPSCVATEGGIFNTGLWGLILALCVGAAVITVILAIVKGVGQMMRGQASGLGQAIKSVMPLVLMAALFATIATLPTILLPTIGTLIELIFESINALIP